jgi:hypothetical protein
MIGRIPRLSCANSIVRLPTRTARPLQQLRPFTRSRQAPQLTRAGLHARSYASGPGEDKKGFKVSYLFGGLVGLGLLVTIYGL